MGEIIKRIKRIYEVKKWIWKKKEIEGKPSETESYPLLFYSMVGFLISAMVAVIIVMFVTFPITDLAMSNIAQTSETNMSAFSDAAQSLISILPLFLVVVFLLMFMRAVL